MEPINPIHQPSTEKISEINFQINIQTPPLLYEDYFEEVKTNILNDKNLLIEKFEIKGEIHTVIIEQAGDETHFRGKLSLFLTLKTHQGETKILYKPRSVSPEIILEDFLSELTQTPRRTILDCGEYGYDTFINGIHLVNKNNKKLLGIKLILRLIQLSKKNRENKILITVLHVMKFEDIHPDNFILDNRGILHFIDAEAYQIGMAENVSDVYENDEFRVDANLENQIKMRAKPYIENLRRTPSRVIFCSTKVYVFPLDLTPKKIKIGNFNISNNEKNFNNYHSGCVAQFLFKLNLFTPRENMTFEEMSIQINDKFIEINAIKLIENELTQVNELKNYGELPAFRFHLIEKWIECPVSGVRLHLKAEE